MSQQLSRFPQRTGQDAISKGVTASGHTDAFTYVALEAGHCSSLFAHHLTQVAPSGCEGAFVLFCFVSLTFV